jgi:hypothetical protein
MHTCTGRANQPLGDSHQSQAIVIYNYYVHTSAQIRLAQHLMLAAYVLKTRDPYSYIQSASLKCLFQHRKRQLTYLEEEQS